MNLWGNLWGLQDLEGFFNLNLLCRSSGACQKINLPFSINILPLWGNYPFSDLSVSRKPAPEELNSNRIVSTR
jgi:hypothetical protein